ncbi:hypothetical protein EGR_11160 [Echinococcus granulosus]|uniref:Uncharacterized protein n=1 Tax=Echinococcus granulosus TaxID=6210 RepID=W6TZ37_ECHGR|nr:hypothetical protein EGR_11160 [Echinococcus granulosus]EUB53983.1 hypothetical protein EGR_11160 [Echinococcus granulosus]
MPLTCQYSSTSFSRRANLNLYIAEVHDGGFITASIAMNPSHSVAT